MRVGIVGCGGMGGVHANKYAQMPGVQMSVYDVDKAKLEAFCTSRNATQAGSMTELLETCDAMDVCLPTPYHCDAVVTCLDAGLPTLIEKPMARSETECQVMIEASKRSGALLVPAHVVRFFPEFRRAHDLIAQGEIGAPASIRIRRGGGAPKADWFLDVEKSGGILLDLAVHDFDWLLWTLGPAKQVTSRSVRLGDRNLDADFKGDYALTTITFENGCVAHVESTWMDPSGTRFTLEASGNKGLIEYDSRENPSLRTHTSGTVLENLYSPTDDPYYRQMSAFIAAAKGEQPPAVTADEGMAAVRVATAAVDSAKTGQTIVL